MRLVASDEPTRPHPTTTTCTSSSPCPAAASRQRGVILGTDLPGTLLASDTMTTRVLGPLKRLVVGAPIASSEEHHQRLTKKIALAVFASDAISSTAYATEEILLVLVPVAGMAALEDLVPLAARRRASCSPSSSRATARRSTPTRSGGGTLRRVAGEPRRNAVARRRRVAPRRLRPHRRGVGVGRRRRHRLGVPELRDATAWCSASASSCS